ncbi:hypothetical protein RHP75_00975 [Pseudomonas sp. SG20056]|uniref:hypothetical protein n=1 Tax=Pseudomonas sp. SG20056 TaxID=3074146 RepID=UPI00287FC1F0|nr:hypothetical protein [Pseudomonas sp. SG20056]WNF47040.1 hypothetical protein RHP75_00975 [Pseudomonas sp. SG20056]
MSTTQKYILAALETLYMLTPILICIIILTAFNYRTTEGVIVSWFTMPEWSFLSSFLFVTIIREKAKKELFSENISNNFMFFVLGSLSILSGSILGILYAVSTNLIAAPIKIDVLGSIQFGLLAAAMILHTIAKAQSIDEQIFSAKASN